MAQVHEITEHRRWSSSGTGVRNARLQPEVNWPGSRVQSCLSDREQIRLGGHTRGHASTRSDSEQHIVSPSRIIHDRCKLEWLTPVDKSRRLFSLRR